MMANQDINKVEISGKISQLFFGLELANVTEKDIIGLPIKDRGSNVVGEITRVDGENWFGEVTESSLV